jgi:hypothetical protein
MNAMKPVDDCRLCSCLYCNESKGGEIIIIMNPKVEKIGFSVKISVPNGVTSHVLGYLKRTRTLSANFVKTRDIDRATEIIIKHFDLCVWPTMRK